MRLENKKAVASKEFYEAIMELRKKDSKIYQNPLKNCKKSPNIRKFVGILSKESGDRIIKTIEESRKLDLKLSKRRDKFLDKLRYAKE